MLQGFYIYFILRKTFEFFSKDDQQVTQLEEKLN